MHRFGYAAAEVRDGVLDLVPVAVAEADTVAVYVEVRVCVHELLLVPTGVLDEVTVFVTLGSRSV